MIINCDWKEATHVRVSDHYNNRESHPELIGEIYLRGHEPSYLALEPILIKENDATLTITQELAFELLDCLGTSTIYTVMGSQYEESLLPHDFKPHKWTGCEAASHNDQLRAYRKLMEQMQGQIKPSS